MSRLSISTQPASDVCHTSAALVGALGITPLDFLLPLAMYIFLRKPVLWKKILAWILLIFYVIVMILGAVAAIRGIVLDASKHCCQSCCMRFSVSYEHCWRMSCYKHRLHDVISTACMVSQAWLA